MVTEHKGTPESAPPKSGSAISRKSVVGVAVLVLVIVIASVRPEEERPTWARGLLGQIDPPLETPVSPAGQETFAGVVLGSAGHPVGDALVMTGSGALLTWDYTDADGRFALNGIPAGEIVVHVIGDGHETQNFSRSGPPFEGRLELSTPLPEPPSLPELEYVDITGVITAEYKDWGVEGYELWLEPLGPAHEFGAPITSRATIQADRSVSFEDLIAGRYRAALLPPWAQTGTWPNLMKRGTPVIAVGLAEATHIEFVMIAGEIEGTIIDEDGRLVAQALVTVHPEGKPNQLWPPARTDEHGHFILTDVPVGDYVLQAHAGGLLVKHIITMPGSSTLQVDLSLHKPLDK